MKKHKVYAKGEQIHALLSSFTHPNILMPVKAIIKDVKWDDKNPEYLIKILKFYDNFHFLKKYLFNMNFAHSLTDKARKYRLKFEDFKTTADIENRLNMPDAARYYVVVDSIMAVKAKGDMKELFNKIQYYLISKKLQECKELMTRSFYNGTMKLDSAAEFDKRLTKFISDKFALKGEDFNHYLKGL